MRPPCISPESNRAVTLMEILVSVGIIVILAALMFPAVREFGAKGKESKCLANHRSIIQAVMTYAADHDGTLPGNLISGAGDGYSYTQQKLSPYLHVEWTDSPKWKSQWCCPSRNEGSDQYPFSTYSVPTDLFGLGVSQPPKMPVKTQAIFQPSKAAAFACVVANYAIFHTYAYTHKDNPVSGNPANGQLAPWHSGGGTIITFMDGHSKIEGPFDRNDPRRNWFSLNHPNTP